MNTMTGKEVLRAIADGADPSEFEFVPKNGDPCLTILVNWDLSEFIYGDAYGSFRRKPRTRVVNGFTVPAPIQEMPKDGYMYFLAVADASNWFATYKWDGSSGDNLWFSRGLLFSTKEAAIANAKAMVGINPESEA